MRRTTVNALVAAIVAFLAAGGAVAGEQRPRYDVAATVGADQVASLHDLSAGRMARLRSQRPEAARLPASNMGGPSGSTLTAASFTDMVASARDIPLFTSGIGDLGLWTRGFGRKTDVGTDAGGLGFAQRFLGGSAGIDMTIGENWVVGGAVAASTGEVKWWEGGGSGNSLGSAGTFYASYLQPNFFLDLSLGGGWTETRSSLGPDSEFARNDLTIGTRVNMGLDLDWAGFNVKPTVSADFLNVGDLSGGLDVLGAISDSPRLRRLDARIGVDVSRRFDIGEIPFEATGTMVWHRTLTMDETTEGDVVPISAVSIDGESLHHSLRLSLELSERWDAFAGYVGDYAGDADRHALSWGLRRTF